MAAVSFPLTACSGKTEAPRPAESAKGATVYQSYCMACHQADGRGQVAGGARLAADFTTPGGPLARPDEELLTTIRYGRTGSIGAMPPWNGILSTQQQRDVLAYLRAQFTPPPPPPPAG